MDLEIKTLEKIGLTEKQAIVYTALLELGEAPMTTLARHANLKRPTVYLVVNELDMLGLLSEVTKGKKKIYSAVHPKRITELLEFRKKRFDELLPTLLAKYGSASGKPKIQMLEGFAGVQNVYKDAFELLGQEKEGLWIGNIEILLEKFPEVLREYDRLIKGLKRYSVREIIFGGTKAKKWTMEQNAKNKSHSLKYWEEGLEAGATDQLIIGNKTIIFSLQKEIFTLIIEGEEIAKTNRALFESLWKKL